MLSTVSWICLPAFLYLISTQVDALSCYQCSGLLGCNDAFQSGATGVTKITQRSSNNNCKYCSKQKSLSYGHHDVSRSCVGTTDTTTYQLGCFEQESSSQDKRTECYCDTDNCNHGNAVTTSVTMVISALVLCVVTICS